MRTGGPERLKVDRGHPTTTHDAADDQRVAANRVATKFLTLERTHNLLHDAEVAATVRLLTPADRDMAHRRLVAATGRAALVAAARGGDRPGPRRATSAASGCS
jgi:hypothetical protein